MIDREKLIKGLECCIRMNSRLDERDCDDCPYNYQSDGTCTSLTPLLEDALALLKEQKALIREYAEILQRIADIAGDYDNYPTWVCIEIQEIAMHGLQEVKDEDTEDARQESGQEV